MKKIIKYFLDIPIYRCPSEKHEEEMEKEKSGWEETNTLKQYFEREIWYPWLYNDIVGFIRLLVHGKSIKGELWFDRAKRVQKHPKRRIIKYKGKAFEFHPSNSMSSENIFQELKRKIENIKKGRKYLKNRYIKKDNGFEEIGKAINWKEFLNL